MNPLLALALAGAISLCFVALAVASFRRDVTRRATGRLLAIGGALLVVQILLGALTVWRLLAVWTVTSHLLVGNAFAVVLALCAGASRIQVGYWKNTERLFGRAIELDPGNFPAHLVLADALMHERRLDDATDRVRTRYDNIGERLSEEHTSYLNQLDGHAYGITQRIYPEESFTDGSHLTGDAFSLYRREVRAFVEQLLSDAKAR